MLQMKTRIDKSVLTDKVTEAREEHKRQYEAALKGWVEKMHEAAVAVIDQVHAGTLRAYPSEFRKLSKIPSLHLDDYDRALEMLRLSVDVIIELDSDDFNHLVLGNWAWKQEWQLTNALYTGGGSEDSD